ncbi:MAG: cytochrome c oxidase subunit II [Verrucomicrobia bacterium]|nr:cytochrome c oxidase subunit II [Verrucomicrobiota bacterium]
MIRELLGLPVLASEHGERVDNLIIYMHWLMAVLFVGWMAYFVYVVWRFRTTRNPKADHIGARGHSSTWIEGLVALVEMVLLFGLAVPWWMQLVDRPPSESESVVLRVVAQQFGWNARYSGKDNIFGKQDARLVNSTNKFGADPVDPQGKDDFMTYNDVHVPLGKPVIIHLTSMDVIHSFKVIALRVCQDAIPGLSIPVWFKAKKEGKYQINCAQLCGAGHATMAGGFITIESQQAFDNWVAQQSKAGGASSGSFE